VKLALALLFVSSPAFAVDVCTITNAYKDGNLMAWTMCTNAADAKTVSRVGGGGVDTQMQSIAAMKSELIKGLLEAGFHPIDGTTFAK
jgi:hypothetical protein